MATLYFGGDIITMEETVSGTGLLEVNGLIREVGDYRKLMSIRPSDTRLVNLRGKALLPAFIDAHSHLTSVARTLDLVNLEGTSSFEELKERIEKFCQERKIAPGKWISGFGYDHNFLREHRHPSKKVLDEVSPDNPIVITHASGHMGIMNSKALQLMGIDHRSEDPPGGMIGRLEGSHYPNGYLEETAFTSAISRIPLPSFEDRCRQLEKAEQIYFENGITTIQEGLTKRDEWNLLLRMSEEGRLKSDVVCYADLKDHRTLFKESGARQNRYMGRLKMGGYKIFLDGSPQGRTAWLREPYLKGDAGYRGYPIYSDHQVRQMLAQAIADQGQILCHCNGDAAAEQMIRAYEEAGGKNLHMRPVMIHAQLVGQDQLKKMADLSMIASFFIAHTYHWGDVHLQNFGSERAMKISPAASAKNLGVCYTFHQDSPVLPPNMMEVLWCAVNRISREGIVMGEDEKINVYDALKGITINAAYQYFEEDKKGSLRPGKLADLVILDRNPLRVPVNELRDIHVVETIKEGKPVFVRNPKELA